MKDFSFLLLVSFFFPSHFPLLIPFLTSFIFLFLFLSFSFPLFPRPPFSSLPLFKLYCSIGYFGNLENSLGSEEGPRALLAEESVSLEKKNHNKKQTNKQTHNNNNKSHTHTHTPTHTPTSPRPMWPPWLRFTPGGGTDLERGMGMCRGHDPLFSGHPALLSLPIYHHCATLMPLIFKFLKKFSIFSLVLVKISALKTQIFQIFVP